MAKAPFPWFGGKATPKIKSAILNVLPEHKYYVEPFGGGASILLAKKPAEVEVYNDANRALVNFFRVIADPDLFALFLVRVQSLPTSRELYEEFLRTWPAIHDQTEQAVRWYYCARLAFGGIFGNTLGTGITTNFAARWSNAFDNLPLVHQRLQGVMLECLDWREILTKYNNEDYLAYCDPPYVAGQRRAGGYEHELKNDDHAALIAAVMAYQGSIVLSGYDDPLYAPLQEAGWSKSSVDVVCAAAGRTRHNGLLGAGKSKATQGRTECIWLNPRAQRNQPRPK